MVTWSEDGDLMESSSRRMERSQSMDLKDTLPVNTQILVVDLGGGRGVKMLRFLGFGS